MSGSRSIRAPRGPSMSGSRSIRAPRGPSMSGSRSICAPRGPSETICIRCCSCSRYDDLDLGARQDLWPWILETSLEVIRARPLCEAMSRVRSAPQGSGSRSICAPRGPSMYGSRSIRAWPSMSGSRSIRAPRGPSMTGARSAPRGPSMTGARSAPHAGRRCRIRFHPRALDILITLDLRPTWGVDVWNTFDSRPHVAVDVWISIRAHVGRRCLDLDPRPRGRRCPLAPLMS